MTENDPLAAERFRAIVADAVAWAGSRRTATDEAIFSDLDPAGARFERTVNEHGVPVRRVVVRTAWEADPQPNLHAPIDDDTAAWIKLHRDSFFPGSGDESQMRAYEALDDLLDDYRDHRATGTPLDREVQGHDWREHGDGGGCVGCGRFHGNETQCAGTATDA